MQKKERKIISLFEEFGTLIPLDVNTPNLKLFKFSCDTEKMYTKDNILSAMRDIIFAVVLKSNGECFLLSFRVGTQEGIEKDILYIINEVNKSSEYGKYTLSSNGDIDWEYRFDIEHANPDDIEKILTSFFNSLLRLVVLIRQYKFQKKE